MNWRTRCSRMARRNPSSDALLTATERRLPGVIRPWKSCLRTSGRGLMKPWASSTRWLPVQALSPNATICSQGTVRTAPAARWQACGSVPPSGTTPTRPRRRTAADKPTAQTSPTPQQDTTKAWKDWQVHCCTSRVTIAEFLAVTRTGGRLRSEATASVRAAIIYRSPPAAISAATCPFSCCPIAGFWAISPPEDFGSPSVPI